MAAAVDCFSPAIAGSAPRVQPAGGAEGGLAEFSCNACAEVFSGALEQRAHCKTERHVYNTKRRLNGLKPISQDAWERKLKESRGAAGAAAAKGTSHLKAGKPTRSKAGSESSSAVAGAADAEPSSFSPPDRSPAPDAREEDLPFSPRRSLFDRKHFDSVEDNLKHMWKLYDFQVPDREYCTDLNGLLRALWEKISEPPHACLFCNRKFPDAFAVRKHMLDKRHARIGTEARTRRGGTDDLASRDMQSELEDFYDFHSSTREVTERITDSSDRVACIVRFFDADRDGRLKYKELAALWAAAHSPSVTAEDGRTDDGGQSEQVEPDAAPALSEAMYRAACSKSGADPEDGLDADELQRLYDDGLANLDEHFGLLQDLLARKLKSHNKKLLRRLAEEEESDSSEEGSDAPDAEDDDEAGSESSAEVWECDDEDEFEEVMRVLGLQPVAILDNGDIRLPSGRVAVHREVAYIWKQRCSHNNQLVARGTGAAGKSKPMLAISNGDGCRVAVSDRARARDNKKVIAVLRKQADWELKMGMKSNKMQRKCLKIRTGMGDASGGR